MAQIIESLSFVFFLHVLNDNYHVSVVNISAVSNI